MYLNDEDPAGPRGVTSFDKGHSHEVRFIPPQLDEQGQPITEGGFELAPDPTDGHTHYLTEREVSVDSGDETTDEEKVNEVHLIYKTLKTNDAENFKRGKESEEFVFGKQWTEQQTQKLDGEDRAHLTINKIEKSLDELSGYYRQQRADIKYLPVEDGDQKTADVYNILTKQILENCFYEREEAAIFDDIVRVGRGSFNLYVDFSKDLQGKIVVEKFPWSRLYNGPHEKPDLSDCEVQVKVAWLNVATAKARYREIADKIGSFWADATSDEPREHTTYATDQYAFGKSERVYGAANPDIANITKKEVCVIECWRRVYKDANVIANASDELFINGYGWSSRDLGKVKTLPGFKVIPRKEAKMRITTVVGGVLASDEDPAELAVDDFYTFPVYCKKIDNNWWGKVEAAKDPQREINKRHSQCVDVVNKMSAYGWFYDQTTFVNKAEKDKFIKTAAKPGFMIEAMDLGKIPAKVEGSRFPSELVQLIQLEDQQVTEIMNISVGAMGANESGTALLQKTKLKMTGNEYIFDNLSFAKKKIGRLLIALIRKFYSVERIERIIKNQNRKSPQTLDGQPVDAFPPEELRAIIENAQATEFDVIVDETTHSPSYRYAVFMVLLDMMQKGMQIPPDVLFTFADIPQDQKDKIKESLAAQSEAQQKAEAQKSEMEIGKTLVAHGIIPPQFQYMLPSSNAAPQTQEQQFQTTQGH